MLCSQLLTVLVSFVRDDDSSPLTYDEAQEALERGANIELGNFQPECQLSYAAVRVVRQGKDAAIDHMLAGGNGFAETRGYGDPLLAVQFDIGLTEERRDLRANMVWAGSLSQALADRKRGCCNG